jgi:hypothetical protein
MSIDTIIYETIYYGNPFEAMELNFFSSQELIDYVAKHVNQIPKNKLYPTFVALLHFYPSIYHYSNGKHLLTYIPNDTVIQRIFVIMGGSPELPVTKEDLSNTLWSIIFDVYSEFVNDTWSEEFERCMLLCNKITPKLSKKELLFKDKEFISSLYEYRCDKIISMLPLCGFPTKDTIEYSIVTDWFDQYPIVGKFYEKYIDRVEYLKNNAPQYYQKIMEQFLYQLCTITLRDFEKIDFSLLKRTCQCFPQQFTDIDIPDPYSRLSIYPVAVRSYLLGLSCFPRIPSKKELDNSLLTLSKLGIDEYVKITLDKQNYPTSSEDSIMNTEDTLFEKPEYYVSLDRFDIEENGKIYQFTRPEFKKLFTDRKNFWTKQPLSYSDLYSLQVRLQMCRELNLPSPDTLKNLLDKACNGTLYEESLEKQQNTTQNTSEGTGQISNQSLLYLYQMFLTNPNLFTTSEESESIDSFSEMSSVGTER